ncbi:MAG: GNAT family N-acetyltransferase [Chloroherpetonaceae bacterium]|nr:GNAT family N-acetyltransferase [Chloroherpetonaceae bacterium]
MSPLSAPIVLSKRATVEVRLYEPSLSVLWDDFVWRSNNGTFFHLQRFLSYHPVGRFEFHHLLFYRGRELLSVLPAAVMEGGKTLESPIGASYGGFVLPALKYPDNEHLVNALLSYAAKQGFKKILLTHAPFIYQKRLIQDMDYALAFKGFDFERHYISHAIQLEPTDNFTKYFSSTVRRYIHQCQRNPDLKIELCEGTAGIDEFYPILLENKARHGAKPTHTLDELYRLKHLFPDNIFLFLVRLKGKAIGGSLVFLCNPQVALCFYNMLNYEFSAYHPIHYVMNEVVHWAIRKGCRYVNIGVSQNVQHENQMTPAYSLIEFKEKFAAKGVLRSTFRKLL